MAVEKVLILESQSDNPYENLALEEYLLYEVPKDAYLMYLWQNDNTIVIGYNQNPFAQCNVKEVHIGSTYIARRLSGGGTVWHDMGNLNFTFISRKENFDRERNARVILQMLNSLGIPAIKDGRNDITVYDKKISGNAYYENGDFCYHHGTILVRSDLERMNKLLCVDREKWKEKGIDSVRSRVENLSCWLKDITIDRVKSEFKKAFENEFKEAKAVSSIDIDRAKLLKLQEKYASKEWIWGRNIPGDLKLHKRFEWGELSLLAHMEGSRIRDIGIFSDSLEVDIFGKIRESLIGIDIYEDDLLNRILAKTGKQNEMIVRDVISFIVENV